MVPLDLPLTGLRILEIGGGIAGPFCGKLLASLGAEVIKVEPPAGDPCRRVGPFAAHPAGEQTSLLFLYLNTGKLGITAEMSTADGRALFTDLAADADVVLSSLAPGALASLGLSYAQLAERSPQLILTAIHDFGEDGPYRRHQSSELILLALGGLLNMVGDPAREPLRLGGYQAQYAAALAAFTGTLTALYARDLTGRGQRVEVSVMETVAFLEWKTGIFFQQDGKIRRRGGSSQWIVLRCRDGFLAFVYMDEHWPRIVALLADPRLANPRFATREGRLACAGDLRGLLEAWSLQRSKAEAYHTAQAAGIPVGMVADAADLVTSPQYQARGFFASVDHPATGPALYPGVPCTLNGSRLPVYRSPLLGEHNADVYRERLGLAPDEVVSLHTRGVI